MRWKSVLIALSLVTMAAPAGADLGKVGEDTYYCTALVGGGQTPEGVPNVGLDLNRTQAEVPEQAQDGVGGCQASGELVDSGVVTGIDAADGCQAYIDTDEVPGGDALLAEGDEATEGSVLWFHCEAGTTDASNAITVDFDA